MTESPLPRLGACGICSWHPDQRHRIRDAQWERITAGEDPTEVAADWGWTPAQMLALWQDVDDNLVEMVLVAGMNAVLRSEGGYE